MDAKEFSLKTLFLVYVGLMGLLLLTVVASFFHLGPWSAPVSLAIAGGKTFLVVFFFMKLGLASTSLRVVAAAGVLWLSFLAFITLSDYLTRFSFGALGK